LRILVTGGCGFIGSNLVRYLANKDCEVLVVDDLSTGCRENLEGTSAKIFLQDVREPMYARNLEKIDAVVHLAAVADLIKASENPKRTWKINVNGTLNMLEFCRENRVKKLVLASSSAVEGNSLYGATKSASEALCNSYNYTFEGFNNVCLRFSNVYGKYSHNDSVIPNFLKAAKEGKPLVVYGDGEQTRDYVHVLDICQAIYKSLTAGSGVYEIGTEKEVSINQLIRMIEIMIGKELNVEYKPARPIDIRNSVASINKAKYVLNYSPEISLEKGLGMLWQDVNS